MALERTAQSRFRLGVVHTCCTGRTAAMEVPSPLSVGGYRQHYTNSHSRTPAPPTALQQSCGLMLLAGQGKRAAGPTVQQWTPKSSPTGADPSTQEARVLPLLFGWRAQGSFKSSEWGETDKVRVKPSTTTQTTGEGERGRGEGDHTTLGATTVREGGQTDIQEMQARSTGLQQGSQALSSTPQHHAPINGWP